MKLKLLVLLIGTSLLAASCEDQEFGFNVGKEVKLEIPVNYETTEVLGAVGFNPPATQQTLRLSEVDAFSDALSDVQQLGEVVLEGMAYEITDVSPGEETPLDELTISVEAGNETIELISLTGTLQDIEKTEIPLTSDQLQKLINELESNGNDITTIVNIDFASTPSEDIEMNLNVFFDITLKIRESLSQ
ncbi:MAG: hypothetical protein WBA74_16330 [Cyclobacteriaceae bacterium]